MKKSIRLLSLLLSVLMCAVYFPSMLAVADEGGDSYLFFDSFEYAVNDTSTPKGWTIYTGTSGYYYKDDKPSEGKSYIVVEDNSDTKGAGFRTNNIEIEPAQLYKVIADVKAFEGGGGQIYLEFWNSSGKRIDVKIGNSTGKSDWGEVEVIGVAPKEATYLTVLLYSGGAAQGVVGYDNIRISSVNEEADVEKFVLAQKGHPRLYYTSDEAEEFKANSLLTDRMYNGHSMSDYRSNIIASADRFLTEKEFTLSYYGDYKVTFNAPTDMPGRMDNPPGFAGSGTYPYWTSLSRNIQTRMQTLAVAYTLTGDERYADKAVEWVRKMATWTAWSDPYYSSGSTCLDTAHITYGVCTVYDLMYDFLTESDKDLIENALYTLSMEKLYFDIHSFSPDNGQMLRCAALMTACCTIYEDNEAKISVYLHKALEFFNRFMDTMVKEADHEGLMYTSYGVEYMIVALDHYARTFGDMSVIKHEFLDKHLMEWIVTAAENTKGLCVNIADCSPSTGNFFITASTVYRLTKNPLAGYYLVRNKSASSGLDALIYTCHDVEAITPDDKYLTFNVKNIGWSIFRTGWSPSDPTLFANSSGSRMGHCHKDANSFVLAYNGAWLAADPGYHSFDGGDETAYGSSGGHNTIYIDDKEQTLLGAGDLDQLHSSPYFAMAVGHAAGAYEKSLGLTQFDRTYMMVGFDRPYYIIRDQLKASVEHNYTWRLNINGYSSFSKGDNTNFTVGYTGALLGVDFAYDDALDIRNTKYKTTSHWVVDVTSEKVKEYEYLAVLTPYSSTSGKYEFKNYAGNFTLVGDGAEAEIRRIDIYDALLFKPKSIGDSISVDVSAGANALYDIKIRFLTGKTYGAAKLLVNGKEITTIDSYRNDYVNFDTVTLNDVQLQKGMNTFEFVWTESASENADKFALVYADLSTDVVISPEVSVVDSEKNDKYSFAELTYDDGSARDMILFNNTKNDIAYTKGDVSINGKGEFFGIFGSTDEGIEGFSADAAKSLVFNGETLFESDMSVDITVNYKGEIYLTSSSMSNKVKIKLPDGIEEVTLGDTKYTADNGVVVLNISNGSSVAIFDMTNDNEDPTEGDGEKDPSEVPSDNNVIWIVIVMIAVVVLVGALVFIFTKKRK